ncbi:alpha/beta hydrolase [candidate division KSB1 bacterium]|nr:alpha/beta hydrolase [candidate division KSB1 bacterium]
MQSIKSKIFNFIMRHRHLLQGKIKKETFDFNTSIEKFREQCEKGASRYAKLPQGITIKDENIDGIQSEWIIPAGADPEKLILYVHGGGYVSGSCNDHRGFVSKFARDSGYVNLVYEYRLAPEHPFPAALDDSIKIYKSLFERGFKAKDILIAGESAGGGLALAILLAIREQTLPLPAAAVAISPWTDLTCSSASYSTKNKRSVAPLNSWIVFSKYYVGDNPADLPLISPLFGDLRGLPPIFINSGTDDELFEDGEKFYLKAKEAGVDVTFRSGSGMVHCYPLLAPMFREATEAMEEICDFIRAKLG